MHSSFGLEFGSAFHPQQLGVLGYLAISAPTLCPVWRCANSPTTFPPINRQPTWPFGR